ncbi:MAG: HTTM domain-containing protein [bacterium]
MTKTYRLCFNTIRRKLSDRVDASSLLVFRILFGLLMVQFAFNHFNLKWMRNYFTGTSMNFYHWPLSMIKPLPPTYMKGLLVLLGVAGLCLAAGLLYRLSALSICLITFYLIFCEYHYYQNHIYLVGLLAFLFFLTPLNRVSSVDCWLFNIETEASVPTWSLWMFRFQLAVVYGYAGFWKLNPDWLNCIPLATRLAHEIEIPLFETFLEAPATVMVLAWGTIAFEFLLVPGLLWKYSRPLAFASGVLFHGMTKFLFNLDLFPRLAIAALTLFLAPSWPKAVGLRPGSSDEPINRESDSNSQSKPAGKLLCGFLIVYCLIQLIVPLRGFIYDGSIGWTRSGQTFAWRMFIDSTRDQDPREIKIVDRNGRILEYVDPGNHLTKFQYLNFSEQPVTLAQFARFVRKQAQPHYEIPIAVRANIRASYNGRKPQFLVDPTVDLSRVEIGWGTPDWIRPLKTDYQRGRGCLF